MEKSERKAGAGLPSPHTTQKSQMWNVKGWFSEQLLAQGPTTFWGHFSCLEFKAFSKTRRRTSEGPGEPGEWGHGDCQERAWPENVRSIIM